jgi:hypothetical protein
MGSMGIHSLVSLVIGDREHLSPDGNGTASEPGISAFALSFTSFTLEVAG